MSSSNGGAGRPEWSVSVQIGASAQQYRDGIETLLNTSSAAGVPGARHASPWIPDPIQSVPSGQNESDVTASTQAAFCASNVYV